MIRFHDEFPTIKAILRVEGTSSDSTTTRIDAKDSTR